MDLKKTRREGVDEIQLAQYGDQWWRLVNKGTNLSENAGNFVRLKVIQEDDHNRVKTLITLPNSASILCMKYII
jgi:hypothetical protein